MACGDMSEASEVAQLVPDKEHVHLTRCQHTGKWWLCSTLSMERVALDLEGEVVSIDFDDLGDGFILCQATDALIEVSQYLKISCFRSGCDGRVLLQWEADSTHIVASVWL